MTEKQNEGKWSEGFMGVEWSEKGKRMNGYSRGNGKGKRSLEWVEWGKVQEWGKWKSMVLICGVGKKAGKWDFKWKSRKKWEKKI